MFVITHWPAIWYCWVVVVSSETLVRYTLSSVRNDCSLTLCDFAIRPPGKKRSNRTSSPLCVYEKNRTSAGIRAQLDSERRFFWVGCQALGGRPPINATILSISTLLRTKQFDARFRTRVTEGAVPGAMSRVYQEDALG